MNRTLINTVQRANRTFAERLEYVRDAAMALIEEHRALEQMDMSNAERAALSDSPMPGLMVSVRMYERSADTLFMRHQDRMPGEDERGFEPARHYSGRPFLQFPCGDA